MGGSYPPLGVYINLVQSALSKAEVNEAERCNLNEIETQNSLVLAPWDRSDSCCHQGS
ncbi:hypothetical protein D3C77_261930 [compost metagenome]